MTITKNNMIHPANHEEWLVLRQDGIGASEASTLLGENKYQTPFDLWELKTGKQPPFEGNKFTESGQKLEPIVVDYFEEETPHRVIKSSADDIIYLLDGKPYIRCTPDRKLILDRGGKSILECKTSQQSITKNDIPRGWFIQLQYQLGIMKYDAGFLAWLIRGVDFDYEEYIADNEFFLFMVDLAERFWNDHVVADIPPDPINASDINKIFAKHLEGQFLQVDASVVEDHARMIALGANIKKEIEELDKLKEENILLTGKHEGLKYQDQILSTYKQNKPSIKFNAALFQKENALDYDKYLHEISGKRIFRVKK